MSFNQRLNIIVGLFAMILGMYIAFLGAIYTASCTRKTRYIWGDC